MPAALAAAMKRELRDERIVWSGRPDPRRAFRTALGIWLFAVPWTAFALFWEVGVIMQLLQAIGRGKGSLLGNWVLPFWGLPFIAIGLLMMSAPWFAARQARNSIYVLGETRLLLIRQGFRKLVIRSSWPRLVSTMERTERPDGSGSLKLIFGNARDSDGDLVERSETVENVPDIGRLETLVLEIRDRSRRETT